MVFGAVERAFRGHRWGDVLCSVLFPIPIDVDMNAIFADIVAELPFYVVIVPNNRMPLIVESILQLNDKPRDLVLRPIVP